MEETNSKYSIITITKPMEKHFLMGVFFPKGVSFLICRSRFQILMKYLNAKKKNQCQGKGEIFFLLPSKNKYSQHVENYTEIPMCTYSLLLPPPPNVKEVMFSPLSVG